MPANHTISKFSHFSNLILFCFAYLMVGGCQKQEAEETKEVIRPAIILEITERSDVLEFTFPAVIEAATSKDLVFQVSGQIEKINVRSGDDVKKGALVAQLDQRRFRNELQSARTQRDSAKIEYERAERLIKENAISKSVLDQRKAQLDVALAQLDSAQKSLEDTKLYSPFDGVVAAVQGKELENASPSQPVVTIQTSGAAEAVVQIPANLVARSKNIEPVDTVVILDVANDVPIKAEFYEASGIADEKSQTFEVKFSFTPPESLLVLPGMTGLVRSKIALDDDNQQKQITVPLAAVQSDGTASYIWLVDKDSMTVSRRNISISPSVGESLIVNSGLTAGDLIVGAGASYLHEGMKIRRLEN